MSTRINSKIRGGMTIVMLLITLLMVVACKHDFFEKGDSGLSYLNTDFVEVRSMMLPNWLRQLQTRVNTCCYDLM